jgi:hypothetical protein
VKPGTLTRAKEIAGLYVILLASVAVLRLFFQPSPARTCATLLMNAAEWWLVASVVFRKTED